MKKILLACCCIVMYTYSVSQNKAEKELTETIEKFRKALIDPDSITLSSLVANQLSYGHSTGLIEDRSTFINALITGKADFKTFETSDQQIQWVEKLAMVRHNVVADIVDNGNAAIVNLMILTVWHKQKDGWKLVARQAARLKQ